MKTKLYKLTLVLLAILLNSCGGGGSDGDGGTTWGIDQKSGKPIPVCNGNQDNTTNAILVKAGQEIDKLMSNTILRIWHYQNGDKKVCIVQGEAIIYE